MGIGALQPGHLIVILVIVLLIFGPAKLPELGKAMGDGLRELKKATAPEEGKDGAATTTTAAPVASSASTATVTPITAAARTCQSCHGSVPAGDKFCGNCGASMEPVASTRTA